MLALTCLLPNNLLRRRHTRKLERHQSTVAPHAMVPIVKDASLGSFPTDSQCKPSASSASVTTPKRFASSLQSSVTKMDARATAIRGVAQERHDASNAENGKTNMTMSPSATCALTKRNVPTVMAHIGQVITAVQRSHTASAERLSSPPRRNWQQLGGWVFRPHSASTRKSRDRLNALQLQKAISPPLEQPPCLLQPTVRQRRIRHARGVSAQCR